MSRHDQCGPSPDTTWHRWRMTAGSPTLRERFLAKVVVRESGCWEWVGFRLKAGYGRIRLSRDEGMSLAHRVAWEGAHGPIPSGLIVLHRCDNPACVNPAHLIPGTSADNTRDMLRKGRGIIGTTHPLGKLTPESVRIIRAARASRGDLARRFGVTRAAIRAVQVGRSWRWVA